MDPRDLILLAQELYDVARAASATASPCLLSYRREDRYPSMDALLADLTRGLSPTRERPASDLSYLFGAANNLAEGAVLADPTPCIDLAGRALDLVLRWRPAPESEWLASPLVARLQRVRGALPNRRRRKDLPPAAPRLDERERKALFAALRDADGFTGPVEADSVHAVNATRGGAP